jgi:hypothetical protein
MRGEEEEDQTVWSCQGRQLRKARNKGYDYAQRMMGMMKTASRLLLDLTGLQNS